MDAIKFTDTDETRIEGIAIPYGKDLDGDTFTPDTELALDWYTTRPLLMMHGRLKEFGLHKVGDVVKTEKREDGLWFEAVLNVSDRYRTKLRELIRDGHLHASSGSLNYLVQGGGGSEIKAWPFAELSLVPNPANPHAQVAVKSVLGLEDTAPTIDADAIAEKVADALKRDATPAPTPTPAADRELETALAAQAAILLGVLEDECEIA